MGKNDKTKLLFVDLIDKYFNNSTQLELKNRYQPKNNLSFPLKSFTSYFYNPYF